jgi:hypothetical protein
MPRAVPSICARILNLRADVGGRRRRVTRAGTWRSGWRAGRAHDPCSYANDRSTTVNAQSPRPPNHHERNQHDKPPRRGFGGPGTTLRILNVVVERSHVIVWLIRSRRAGGVIVGARSSSEGRGPATEERRAPFSVPGRPLAASSARRCGSEPSSSRYPFTHIWGQLCGWPDPRPWMGGPATVDSRCVAGGQAGARRSCPRRARTVHPSVPNPAHSRTRFDTVDHVLRRGPSTPSTGPVSTTVFPSSEEERENKACGKRVRCPRRDARTAPDLR